MVPYSIIMRCWRVKTILPLRIWCCNGYDFADFINLLHKRVFADRILCRCSFLDSAYMVIMWSKNDEAGYVDEILGLYQNKGEG